MANFAQNAQMQAAMQQAAMQQGGANPYAAAGAQGMPAGQTGVNPYMGAQAQGMPAGQPASAVPVQQPVPAPASGESFPQCSTVGTVISVSFSDGTMLGYDKMRRSMIATGYAMGSLSTTTIRQVPARPNPPGSTSSSGGSKAVVEEPPAEPMRKEGNMTKLGFKKGVMGMESWQERYFVLDAQSLTYSKGPGAPDIKRIPLSKGMSVNVRHASSPAKKDRFENPHSAVSMLTQPMSSVLETTMGVVGKDNCVELSVPAQLGSMLGSVLGSSPLALAGKSKEISDTKARTYYMSCASATEAEEWRRAIQNNIDALPKEAPGGAAGGQTLPNGINLGQVDSMLNYATQMQNAQEKARDPNTSLEFFKLTLAGTISTDELYQGVSMFYDEMDRNRVVY
mmetsp:Transcript_10149/g.15395  ORF Transcript_10149/g.15395 Transcript_10149/m.15395 type:complete len:396 (+) Transcript_10149:77-1264(+)|eukprot:CAMPEP_0185025452 /NCGR_PEP_ID=MMETSP1103-20130426/8401_1 /TAXON_ID=36769 /ORGANISM="Paraphysomonas bandaiensis, Strain Caron Lab Isolate" /LENGTH=395 /DNA_ID=CAMNT_0027558651 /DNA_START=11 /DNA_END=1198 /DNA_ORIENTATION=+